jgi:hypothetical protein
LAPAIRSLRVTCPTRTDVSRQSQGNATTEDRALLHMAAYLVEREEISLEDGIARAKAAEQRHNENHPIFDAFFEAGRLAYRENSDHRLAETARRVRNNMIVR